jgi:hypothetical protein
MNNLLITTIGEYNHLSKWLDGERNYDVALVNYDHHDTPYDLARQCVWFDTFSTFKYPGIWDMFWDEPRLLRYDYFWMPDDDIELCPPEINKLFDKARTLNLSLSQPSIEKSDTSFPSWEVFIHRESMDFIATNFVEIMCPLFSRDALGKCLDTFRKSQSGWGLDLVWTKLIGDTHSNIGIINSVIAKHTRKIASGSFYPDLQRKKIRPSQERRSLMNEYLVSGVDIKIHGNK